MKEIKTIDLWTEQRDNHYDVINGCFMDGFENLNSGGGIPFDKYKIVKNCNCIISCSDDKFNITNKHNAIVFYKKKMPVRLLVINQNTDIEKCIGIALNQYLKDNQLKEIYHKFNIKEKLVDLKEKPIKNKANKEKEVDVGSCDRWALLYSMLKGSYTESESGYGNFESCKYEFIPNIKVMYDLTTDNEKFKIEHECAFVNDIHTRMIPIQINSKLTK